uniref:Uncharacterized protein n=1 Tax=Anguilla anguilla TaxID=7936 RepID=A0A0E9Q7A7_ANGAN
MHCFPLAPYFCGSLALPHHLLLGENCDTVSPQREAALSDSL